MMIPVRWTGLRLIARLGCWLAAFGLLVTAVRAKAPPDWVKPVLLPNQPWKVGDYPATQLLDLTDVRYVGEDRVHRMRRSAIRLESERGRTRMSVAYGYNADMEKIVSAQAWVISPDGRTSQVFSVSQFSDVASQQHGIFWPQQRVLSFPESRRVAVGGVLAWEIHVESQTGITDINWSILSDLPVGRSVLEVTPMPGGRIEWYSTSARIAAPVPGSGPGGLRWEVFQLVPSAGDRPDGFLPEPHLLSVRGIPAQGSPRLQSWSDLARMAGEIIEQRIIISPDLKLKAESLVAGKAGRWERIRALTEFVQREIAYLAVVMEKDYLAGYRPHFADNVLRDRRGDCKDKAALLTALLRAIDEKSQVILVFAGNPRAVREGWPSAAFNHAINGIRADETVPAGWPVVDAGPLGRLVIFDATDSYTPLGVLSGGVQGGFGLVAAPQASTLVRLPINDASHNRYDCRIDASLGAQGELTARVDELTRGVKAGSLRGVREQLRDEKFTRLIEARLHETIPLVQELHWTDTWEPAESKWRLLFSFQAERYARRTGGSLMLVSPAVLFAKLRLAPWKTDLEGVVAVAASTIRKEVRLALPAGVIVEELPEDARFELGNARCTLTYRRQEDTLVYCCDLTQQAGFLGKKDYEALRAFMQKLDDAERRPVVIRRGPVSGVVPKAKL